jgi:hypothetical protein
MIRRNRSRTFAPVGLADLQAVQANKAMVRRVAIAKMAAAHLQTKTARHRIKKMLSMLTQAWVRHKQVSSGLPLGKAE